MSSQLIKLIKKHFYYSDKLDYDKISEFMKQIHKHKNYIFVDKFIKPIDNHAYYEINDPHNQFVATFIEPQSTILKTKIKIKIPSFVGMLKDKYSNQFINIINNYLYKAYIQNIQIVEIDLTQNFGGYQNVMIIGLQSLFEQNELLYQTIDKEKNITDYYLSSFQEYEKIRFKKFKYNPKQIIIKKSQNTSSAGEFVATCFIGKKNTKFIGNKTAGLCGKAFNYEFPNGDIVLFTRELLMKNNKIIKYI